MDGGSLLREVQIALLAAGRQQQQAGIGQTQQDESNEGASAHAGLSIGYLWALRRGLPR
jgi:hypothetical protein